MTTRRKGRGNRTRGKQKKSNSTREPVPEEAMRDKLCHDMESTIRRLVGFAIENPALGDLWLSEVLSSPRPELDPFWNKFSTTIETFTQAGFARPAIDTKVLSVLTLAGSFMWSMWAHTHARTAKERQEMAERFTQHWSLLFLQRQG